MSNLEIQEIASQKYGFVTDIRQFTPRADAESPAPLRGTFNYGCSGDPASSRGMNCI